MANNNNKNDNSDHHLHLMEHYPKGFRPRRGLNWMSIGFMYATFYMCRYNFKIASNGIREELLFDIATLWAMWSIAYGTGQLINGLIVDKFGGKKCMLVGAVGTIIISLVIGFSPLVKVKWCFIALMMVNAYFQAFGAPSFVKINAAWFRRHERGTFAGIFGGMINLGQIAIFTLGPWILSGMAITWLVKTDALVEPGQWRLLFIIPPLFTSAAALLLLLVVKNTPDEAGHKGLIHDEVDDSAGVKTPIKVAFFTIFTNPFVWFYAVAYGCTGAVRHSSDQLGNLYFEDQLGFDMNNNPPAMAYWTLAFIPVAGFLGSLISGLISDKLFGGKRAPVAKYLYFITCVVLVVGAILIFNDLVNPTFFGIFMGCLLLILISASVNATHSLVGSAAPMDIGGKKMAGFASGVIDSFQYYGAAISLFVIAWIQAPYKDAAGKVSDKGWLWWFIVMAAFSFIGGFAMWFLKIKHRRIDAMEANS